MELLMNKRELLDLGENLRGVSIVCREGRCWLTQAGDSRDHILTAGGSFTVRSSGKLIVTAAEGCRLMLTSPEPKSPTSQSMKNIYALLKSCTAGSI